MPNLMQPLSPEWTRIVGTKSADTAFGLVVSADGFIYLAGYLGEGSDGYTTKISPSGITLWSKTLNQGATANSRAIATNLNNEVFVGGLVWIGGTQQSGYLANFSDQGAMQWFKQNVSSVSNYIQAVSVAADGSGFVYTAGDKAQANSNSTYDGFIQKYRLDGSLIWESLLTSTNDDRATSITTSNQGAVYVTGSTNGSVGSANLGNSDAYIARFTSEGKLSWIKQFGSANDDGSNWVTTLKDGSIVIVGSTYGSLPGKINLGENDAFIAKYSSDGELTWITQFGTNKGDNCWRRLKTDHPCRMKIDQGLLLA